MNISHSLWHRKMREDQFENFLRILREIKKEIKTK